MKLIFLWGQHTCLLKKSMKPMTENKIKLIGKNVMRNWGPKKKKKKIKKENEHLNTCLVLEHTKAL